MAKTIDNEKRAVIIYVTIILWLVFGIASPFYGVSFAAMSVYFLSLTGFVSIYVWGESVRKSTETSIFSKGKTSTREKMLYITILCWILLGVFGLFGHSDFVELGAYFGSLTPFVGAYILGRTYKQNNTGETTTETPPTDSTQTT